MSFPEALQTTRRAVLASIAILGSLAIPITASATLPPWLQHIVGASTSSRHSSARCNSRPLKPSTLAHPRRPRPSWLK